jgi:hypothetical protein
MNFWARRATLGALIVATLFTPLAASAIVIKLVSGIRGGTDKKSEELVALPSDAADRVARRDLLSVLQPAGKFRLGMGGNVEGTTFVTWPYVTNYRHVCREDRVTLVYSIAGHDQTSPEGVEAQAMYHIEQLPVPGLIGGGSYWTNTCDAHHPDSTAAWFAAPTDTDAVRAANMFRRAEDEVKAKRLTPGPCDETGGEPCRQRVLSLDDPSKIASVEPCAATARDTACYVISFDGYQLTIVATLSTEDNERITPDTLVSVRGETVLTGTA